MPRARPKVYPLVPTNITLNTLMLIVLLMLFFLFMLVILAPPGLVLLFVKAIPS